jgi:hypothetical protein
MHTLLRWLGTLGRASRSAEATTFVSMRDISYYIRFFSSQYQQQFALRVERILNSNGLSLQMSSQHKFEPRELAKMFAPIHEPTVKRCFCGGHCHDHATVQDPNNVHYCDCMRAMRYKVVDGQMEIEYGRPCAKQCYCSETGCQQQHFNEEIAAFTDALDDM